MSDEEQRQAFEHLSQAIKAVLAHSPDRRTAFSQIVDQVAYLCDTPTDATLTKAAVVVKSTGWAVRRGHDEAVDRLHRATCDYLTERGFPFLTREEAQEFKADLEDEDDRERLRREFYGYQTKREAGEALLRFARRTLLRGLSELNAQPVTERPSSWAESLAATIGPWVDRLQQSPWLRGRLTWTEDKSVDKALTDTAAELHKEASSPTFGPDDAVRAALRGFGLDTRQAARFVVQARKDIEADEGKG